MIKWVVLGALILSVSACAKLDEYLPRETQCLLYSTVKEAAKQHDVNVEDYMAIANQVQIARGEEPLVICPVGVVAQ